MINISNWDLDMEASIAEDMREVEMIEMSREEFSGTDEYIEMFNDVENIYNECTIQEVTPSMILSIDNIKS